MGLIIRLGILVLISFVIIKTSEVFPERPEYKIKTVELDGLSEDLDRDLPFLKEGLVGRKISAINLKQLENLLKEDIRLEEVKVNQVDFNKIKISLKKRKPKYYIQHEDKIYCIDKNNIIYGEIGDEKISSLPFILIKNSFEISQLLGIIKSIEDVFEGSISQIYREDKYCVNIVLTNGAVLKTNTDVAKEKYYTGRNLCFGLSKEKKIDYVDLRFQDYVVKYLEDKDGK